MSDLHDRGATATTRFEPLDRAAVRALIERHDFDVRSASIREMNKMVSLIEAEFDLPFIRMEFGIPGLPTAEAAVEAEVDAVRERRVGHVYAPFEGVPALKEEAARFVKLFMNVDVDPSCCIPTVGAMQGCFASIMLASRLRQGRNKILFLDPGFPVNKLQLRLLGLEQAQIDLYDHRGEALIEAVRERVSRGDVGGILWSSPNNPSWVVLKDFELRGIAEVCDEHDVLAIEDLAYFGMDTRQDYYTPGQPPYQPTVLHHTQRGICIISSSKIFSYAGQRIALCVLPPELFSRQAPDLVPYYGTASVGHAFVHGGLYPVTASVPESPQYGLLALLRGANEGDRALFEPAAEYTRRAKAMKALFLQNGFRLVYDNDLGDPLADGFYFTIAHPAYEHGADLIAELLHYGVSAITLESTGSCRIEGLRACVSLTPPDRFGELEARLQRFAADHPGR